MDFDIPDQRVLEEVLVRAEQDAADGPTGSGEHGRSDPIAIGAVIIRIAEFCWIVFGRTS